MAWLWEYDTAWKDSMRHSAQYEGEFISRMLNENSARDRAALPS